MAAYFPRLARPLSLLLSSTPTTPATRHLLPSHIRRASSFQTGPSPPRLPPSEQAEFERLQRTANTQEGFNATSSPDFSTSDQSTTSARQQQQTQSANAVNGEAAAATADANLDGATPTPLRRGAPPEFEGDVNPRTGEVGGPKNEPLRWGPGGDYSFNGRVTDF